MSEAQPAFADNSGGILEPAPDTTFSLSADQVQQMLATDGASAQWVATSPTLFVRSGTYHPLGAGQPGTSPSPAQAGTPSYVFSGNTAPCPPTGGGAGTPATTASQTCTGTVVASGVTGEVEDVEVAAS